MTGKQICLLTTANLTNNPRLVKEADALQCFGFDVTVVACHHDEGPVESDTDIMERAAWSTRLICWDRSQNPRLFWLSRIRRFGCSIAVSALRMFGIRRNPEWLEIRAFDRVLPEIMLEAQSINAELFVGHNPGLLPIAWKLARNAGAKCGFDAEDFHSGMNRSGEGRSLQDSIVRGWEKKYLNRYDYLTAAAPLIAREYLDRYPISFDAVVLNTFDPICEDETFPQSGNGSLSLYWVSQTIGANRGLENVVRALALLKDTSIRLFLRGDWQNGYETRLRILVDELGISQHQVVSLPRVIFNEYVSSAARYDVGLAVEEPISRNRELCLTNKIFMYLSAGLAVAATSTPGQSALMEKIPNAGFVFSYNDHEGLAESLEVWIKEPALLDEAKAAALRAARESYNWKRERVKLKGVVENALEEIRN